MQIILVFLAMKLVDLAIKKRFIIIYIKLIKVKLRKDSKLTKIPKIYSIDCYLTF